MCVRARLCVCACVAVFFPTRKTALLFSYELKSKVAKVQLRSDVSASLTIESAATASSSVVSSVVNATETRNDISREFVTFIGRPDAGVCGS